MNRLKQKYNKEIMPTLAKEFGISNRLALPKITKVVVNVGIGDAVKNKEIMAQVKRDLSAITGQQPQIRPARVSVASFSIRSGMPVGLKSTLRGERMYSFLDKLFSIVLPRLRDFRGVSLGSFDSNGNYTLGIEDHTVFPEIDLAKSQSRGLEVSIVTSCDDKKMAKRLLELMGMPFQKDDKC
jgi:large subunit ribosomal protein L5